MSAPRTVFEILSEVLKLSSPELSPCELAQYLIRGVYDPEVSDPDLVQFLIRCENVLHAGGTAEMRNAAMVIVWLDTTLPAIIDAVALWVEKEFEPSRMTRS